MVPIARLNHSTTLVGNVSTSVAVDSTDDASVLVEKVDRFICGHWSDANEWLELP